MVVYAKRFNWSEIWQTYGIKKVNDYISPKGYKKTKWLCKCSCNNNNMIEVIGTDLVRGKTKSCGCLHSETSYQTGK